MSACFLLLSFAVIAQGMKNDLARSHIRQEYYLYYRNSFVQAISGSRALLYWKLKHFCPICRTEPDVCAAQPIANCYVTKRARVCVCVTKMTQVFRMGGFVAAFQSAKNQGCVQDWCHAGGGKSCRMNMPPARSWTICIINMYRPRPPRAE